jgi:transposase InsO family protein
VATVIDLHSCRLVGWAISDHVLTSLITDALDVALTHRTSPAGVIFHSDRGTQYTSREFARYCTKHKIRRSLGRTGICYDNAVAESVFATHKKELIHTKLWSTIASLKKDTFTRVEEYYNRTRRHSSLEYLTPADYELGYRHIHELAA